MSQPDPKVLIPKLPKNFKETDGVDFDAQKICASTLESNRHKQTILFLNQTLMSFHSKKVREKYSKYLKDNNIQILSDIFERMDLNRRINDSLRILQMNENLTPQQLAEKRKIIFRKLARKTAVHLYQKDGSKARVKRIDDKGKHKVLQKLTL